MTDYTRYDLDEIHEEGKKVGQLLFREAFREVSEQYPVGSPNIENQEDFQEELARDFDERDENYRSHSPFEYFAKQLNERPDRDEAWNSYKEGLGEAFDDCWGDCRVPITEDKAKERTEEWLNDIYGDVQICGMYFDAGKALRDVDPEAFWQEMLNWLDRNEYEIQ